MLQDLTSESKGRIKALVAVAEGNVVDELVQYPGKEIDAAFYNRLVKRIYQDTAMDQAIVEWAMDCWIYALDKESPDRMKQVPAPPPLPSSIGNITYQPMQNNSSQPVTQGTTHIPVQPIKAQNRRTFPIIQISLAILILAGAYKLINIPYNKESPSQKETVTDAPETKEIVNNITIEEGQSDSVANQDVEKNNAANHSPDNANSVVDTQINNDEFFNDNEVEALVLKIRAEYNHINDNQGSHKVSNYYASDDGELHYTKYTDQNGIMRKMIFDFTFINGMKKTREYYFWGNGDFFFCFTVFNGQEDRYYFHNNRMIRWITPEKVLINFKAGQNNNMYLNEESRLQNMVGDIYKIKNKF